MAVALGEQARAVAINRIVGGNPPTAAQFNTSKQYRDIIEQGMLNNMDEVALRDGWDKFLPETVLNVIRVKGHYYAVPVTIHMPTWIWYSKAAFKQAGIAAEPKTMDELFAALDKLKAAGLVPLAHGGQAWQENIIFTAVLANLGGREMYLKVLRDRDAATIQGDGLPPGAAHLQAPAGLRRQGLARPQLERRHRDAHHRQGGYPVHGRLGQGRVHQRRPRGRARVRLHRGPRPHSALHPAGRRAGVPEDQQARGR